MNHNILLAGAGYMATEYVKVLTSMDVNFSVVGRGIDSARKLKENTGIGVISFDMKDFIKSRPADKYNKVIVAVSIESIFDVSKDLIHAGFKNLLIEKPAGLNFEQISLLSELAKEYNVQILVAYNRRYYASTKKAIEIIKTDGGVSSFHFEFTEWTNKILAGNRSKEVLEEWLFANSSHVLDLAFYLGGKPKELKSYTKGSLDWHSKSSIFVGAGVSVNDALFSYQANWEAPGRWGVEILTKKHRLILKPLEELWIQNLNEISIEKVPLENEYDLQYKPGLFKQVENYLLDEVTEMIDIHEHAEMSKIYSTIRGF